MAAKTSDGLVRVEATTLFVYLTSRFWGPSTFGLEDKPTTVTIYGDLSTTTLTATTINIQTLVVTGDITCAGLSASGLITASAGISTTTLSASGATTLTTLSASDLITASAGISTTTLTASGATTLTTLSASGLITASAGISTTTLSASGATTLTTLTASGLITANAGISTTTLTVSGSITASGGISSTGLTLSGNLNMQTNRVNLSALPSPTSYLVFNPGTNQVIFETAGSYLARINSVPIAEFTGTDLFLKTNRTQIDSTLLQVKNKSFFDGYCFIPLGSPTGSGWWATEMKGYFEAATNSFEVNEVATLYVRRPISANLSFPVFPPGFGREYSILSEGRVRVLDDFSVAASAISGTIEMTAALTTISSTGFTQISSATQLTLSGGVAGVNLSAGVNPPIDLGAANVFIGANTTITNWAVLGMQTCIIAPPAAPPLPGRWDVYSPSICMMAVGALPFVAPILLPGEAALEALIRLYLRSSSVSLMSGIARPLLLAPGELAIDAQTRLYLQASATSIITGLSEPIILAPGEMAIDAETNLFLQCDLGSIIATSQTPFRVRVGGEGSSNERLTMTTNLAEFLVNTQIKKYSPKLVFSCRWNVELFEQTPRVFEIDVTSTADEFFTGTAAGDVVMKTLQENQIIIATATLDAPAILIDISNDPQFRKGIFFESTKNLQIRNSVTYGGMLLSAGLNNISHVVGDARAHLFFVGTTPVEIFRVASTGTSISGNLTITGKISSPARITTTNTLANRKIVLYDTTDNDHQFYGFGINNSTLRYQVDGTGAAHRFYCSTSTTTSQELFSITSTGSTVLGTFQVNTTPTYPITDSSGTIGLRLNQNGAGIIEGNDNNFAIHFRKNRLGTLDDLTHHFAYGGHRFYGGNQVLQNQTVFLQVGPTNTAVTGNLTVSGTISSPTRISTTNDLVNRKIVLFDSLNNDHQYNGFGMNVNVIRYQGGDTGVAHKFYCGTSSTTSQELFSVASGAIRANDNPIYLRTDNNHYLNYNATRNGPGLYGFTGGSIGTTSGGANEVAYWDAGALVMRKDFYTLNSGQAFTYSSGSASNLDIGADGGGLVFTNTASNLKWTQVGSMVHVHFYFKFDVLNSSAAGGAGPYYIDLGVTFPYPLGINGGAYAIGVSMAGCVIGGIGGLQYGFFGHLLASTASYGGRSGTGKRVYVAVYNDWVRGPATLGVSYTNQILQGNFTMYI